MPECFVAKASELKDGDRRIVVDGKQEIGVFCQDGTYYAYSNYCVHAGGPACEGLLINRVVDVIAAGPHLSGPGIRRRAALRLPLARLRIRHSRPANASATAASSCESSTWCGAATIFS